MDHGLPKNIKLKRRINEAKYDHYNIISAAYRVCQLNLLLSETGRPDLFGGLYLERGWPLETKKINVTADRCDKV